MIRRAQRDRRPSAQRRRARCLGRHLPRGRRPPAAHARARVGLDPASPCSTAATRPTCIDLVRDELGLAEGRAALSRARTPASRSTRARVNTRAAARRDARRVVSRGAPSWEDDADAAVRARYVERKHATARARLRRPAAVLVTRCRRPDGRARDRARASITCWSTSTRTPTRCRPRSCRAEADGHGVTVVGDDAQAIYSFRAATRATTSSTSRARSRRRRAWSRSSRTTARRSRSSTRRTR